jgi:hypothetical protein
MMMRFSTVWPGLRLITRSCSARVRGILVPKEGLAEAALAQGASDREATEDPPAAGAAVTPINIQWAANMRTRADFLRISFIRTPYFFAMVIHRECFLAEFSEQLEGRIV